MNKNQYPYNHIIYHYTTAEAALEIIYSKNLKVSTFANFPHLNADAFNNEEEFLDIKRSFRLACFSESYENQDLVKKCANNGKGVIIGFSFPKEMFENKPYSLHKTKYVSNPIFDYKNHNRFNSILDWLTSKHYSLAEEQEINLVSYAPERPFYVKDNIKSITFCQKTPAKQKAQLYSFGKQKGIELYYNTKQMTKTNQLAYPKYEVPTINKSEDSVLSPLELIHLLIKNGYKSYMHDTSSIRFKRTHGNRSNILITDKYISLNWNSISKDFDHPISLKTAQKLIDFSSSKGPKQQKLIEEKAIVFNRSLWDKPI